MIKQLGGGGFGVVHQANWHGRGGGQIVAVKQLLISSSQAASSSKVQLNSESRGEFESEMEVMLSIGHPNVIRIFGACIDPTQPLCIVTEFVEHGSLFDVLHDPSITLEWWLRWRMAKQATMGLNYLHHCNPEILHRDVKSLNFLVDKNWDIKICGK